MQRHFKPRLTVVALAAMAGFSAPAYAVFAEQTFCYSTGFCYTSAGPWSYYSYDPTYDSMATYQTASTPTVSLSDPICPDGTPADALPVDPDVADPTDPTTADDFNTGDDQANDFAREVADEQTLSALEQQQANSLSYDFDDEVNQQQQQFRQSEIEDEDSTDSYDDSATADVSDDDSSDNDAYDPISTRAGFVVQRQTDYRARGLFPVWFARTYVSSPGYANVRSAMPLGLNWRSNYDRVLNFSPGNTQAVILRPDGTTYVFNPTSGGGWAPARNIPMQLTAGASGTWIFTTPYGNQEVYDGSGRLLSLVNRHGVTQTFQYDSQFGRIISATDASGRTLQFTYNSAGLLQTIVAPGNATYSFAYNANAVLTGATYPDGTSRTYLYENSQFPSALTGLVDEAGTRIESWAYDSQGRAVSNTLGNNIATGTVQYNTGQTVLTLPTGATKSLQLTTVSDGRHLVTGITASCSGCTSVAVTRTFDANGLLQGVTDANGVSTTYTRDAQGREASRTVAANSSQPLTISRTWNTQYMLETGTSAGGLTTKNTFDATGNLLAHEVIGGDNAHTWHRTYNAQGQVITATNSAGNTTTFTYDALGNLASQTNPLGQKTTFNAWDVNGRLLNVTDPNGLVTQYQYDARGRLLYKAVGTQVTSATWTAFGRLATLTTPDGVTHSYSYDSGHRLVQASDSTGRKAVYTLNVLGQRTNTSVYNADGTLARSSSAAYDGLGHLTQTISGTGQVTQYQHDANGRVTAVVDPLSRTSQFQWDARGRLTTSVDPNQGVTRASYDVLGRLLSVTDPRGVATGYGYDAIGELLQTTSHDAGTHTRGYGSNGVLVDSVDALSQKTLYSFDAGQRVTSVRFADGKSAVLTYDQGTNGVGRLTQVADSSGTTSWQYDAYGHIVQQQATVNTVVQTTQYSVDSAGRVTEMIYPSGTRVDYAYGSDGRVHQVSVNGAVAISGITYDGAGAPTTWNYANGEQVILAFDYAGRQVQNSLYTLGYDNGDRITSMTASATNAAQRNKQFGYDTLDHLTAFSDGRLPMAWTYDANGNRITDQTGTPVDTYQVDTASNRLLSVNEAAQPPVNAFILGFSYDANGNVTSRGSMSMSYDAAQHMTSPGNATYLYNFAGQRVAKSGSSFEDTLADPFVSQTGVTAADRQTRLFAYGMGGQQIGEYFGRGQKIEETVYLGSVPLLVLKGSSVFYVRPDHLGAPRQIADSNGNTVWSWEIAAFGSSAPVNQFTSTTSGFVYNMRFPGQYYDVDSTLLYNWHRYYDGQTGRYLQSDPLGLLAGTNTFSYVNDNPIGELDPEGLQIVPRGTYLPRGPVIAGPPMLARNPGINFILGEFSNLPSPAPLPGDYVGVNFPWSPPNIIVVCDGPYPSPDLNAGSVCRIPSPLGTQGPFVSSDGYTPMRSCSSSHIIHLPD